MQPDFRPCDKVCVRVSASADTLIMICRDCEEIAKLLTKKVSEDVMLFFASDIVFSRLAPVCDDKKQQEQKQQPLPK